MNFLTPVKISLKNLAASKLRSFLTVLGIIIGVSSFMIIFATGQSAQDLIIKRIEGIGSNLVGILPGKSKENGPPPIAFGIVIKTLTYDDLNALRDKKQMPEVVEGAGYATGTFTASTVSEEKAVSVLGVTASYLEVEATEVKVGRFFTKEEEKSLNKVCVIGDAIVRDFFPNEDPIGKKIKIKNQKFEIIGILKKRSAGGLGSGGQDENIFVPLVTAQKILINGDYLTFIRLKVKDAEHISLVKENAAKILRERHQIDNPDEDDFSIRDLASAITLIKNVTNVIRYFLLAVGSISLIVGGVGIMNIMLIAVNQRIREIGLRKAIGAKDKDIALQFVIEAMTVSLTGGVVGILFGIFIIFIIFLIATFLGFNWPFNVSLSSIVISVLVSLVVGVIFGTFPAKKAAKISPMEALRYE